MKGLDHSRRETIVGLRSSLERLGFAPLVEALRASASPDHPWPNYDLWRGAVAATAPPHRTLLALLVAGEEVDLGEAERALGPCLVSNLMAANLLGSEREGRVDARGYTVVPFQGQLFVADLTPHYPVARRRQRNVVVDEDSFLLGRLLPGPPADLLLEPCAGAGLLSIVAAASCRKVLGGELSPVALAAARFNAVLNGVDDRVSFAPSDLFQGFPREPADRVLVNPPYLPLPAGCCDSYLVGDGGPDGLAVIRAVLAELPPFVKRDGSAVVFGGGFASDGALHCAGELADLASALGLSITAIVVDKADVEQHIRRSAVAIDDRAGYEHKLRALCASAGATHYFGFVLRVRHAAGAPRLTVLDPSASAWSRARRREGGEPSAGRAASPRPAAQHEGAPPRSGESGGE